MTVYLVTGGTAYREHDPGERFEADLPADVERRALARGSIVIEHAEPTSMQPGSFRLPRGWHTLTPAKEG